MKDLVKYPLQVSDVARKKKHKSTARVVTEVVLWCAFGALIVAHFYYEEKERKAKKIKNDLRVKEIVKELADDVLELEKFVANKQVAKNKEEEIRKLEERNQHLELKLMEVNGDLLSAKLENEKNRERLLLYKNDLQSRRDVVRSHAFGPTTKRNLPHTPEKKNEVDCVTTPPSKLNITKKKKKCDAKHTTKEPKFPGQFVPTMVDGKLSFGEQDPFYNDRLISRMENDVSKLFLNNIPLQNFAIDEINRILKDFSIEKIDRVEFASFMKEQSVPYKFEILECD